MFTAVNALLGYAVPNSAVIAILGHAVENWTDFDGWALSKGFDPLGVPSRRLCAAVWLWLTEAMDLETKEKLIYDLFDGVSAGPVGRAVTDEPASRGTVVLASKEKWRAPPGWKPPGWNEERSYQTALQFMSFKDNPK